MVRCLQLDIQLFFPFAETKKYSSEISSLRMGCFVRTCPYLLIGERQGTPLLLDSIQARKSLKKEGCSSNRELAAPRHVFLSCVM